MPQCPQLVGEGVTKLGLAKLVLEVPVGEVTEEVPAGDSRTNLGVSELASWVPVSEVEVPAGEATKLGVSKLVSGVPVGEVTGFEMPVGGNHASPLWTPVSSGVGVGGFG